MILKYNFMKSIRIILQVYLKMIFIRLFKLHSSDQKFYIAHQDSSRTSKMNIQYYNDVILSFLLAMRAIHTCNILFSEKALQMS